MNLTKSITSIKHNFKEYNNWEEKQQQIEAKREYLNRNLGTQPLELDQAQRKGLTLINTIDVIDNFSNKKVSGIKLFLLELQQSSDDIVAYTSLLAGSIFALPFVLCKKMKPAIISGIAGFITSAVGSTIAMTLYSSKLQDSAHKIARFEACNKDLKDPKNFVIYNSDQIKKAKEIAKTINLPEDKVPKNTLEESLEVVNSLNPLTLIKTYKTANKLLEDNNEGNEWENSINEIEKKIQENKDVVLTDKQLLEAKKDQDLFFRLIKKIEIQSQDYSETVDIGANTIRGLGIAFGVLGGFILGQTTDMLQKAGKISKESKIANVLKNHSVELLFGVALSIMADIFAAKFQKKAVEVGKFKAKQELLKDPHNFLYYNDKQLEDAKVQNTQTNKKWYKDIFKNAIFFFKATKDFKEYEKYQETKEIENKKLREALKQIKITDKQLTDAQKLQAKTFRVLDVIEKNTQKYSEKLNTICSIAQNLIPTTIYTASFLTVLNSWIKSGVKEIIDINPKNGKRKLNLPKMFKHIAKDIDKVILPALIPSIIIGILTTKIQKNASKIGFMKAMENMKDPKEFAYYTNEQIDRFKELEAKESKTPETIIQIPKIDIKTFLKNASNGFITLK